MFDKCALYHGRFLDFCFHDRHNNVFLINQSDYVQFETKPLTWLFEA